MRSPPPGAGAPRPSTQSGHPNARLAGTRSSDGLPARIPLGGAASARPRARSRARTGRPRRPRALRKPGDPLRAPARGAATPPSLAHVLPETQ